MLVKSTRPFQNLILRIDNVSDPIFEQTDARVDGRCTDVTGPGVVSGYAHLQPVIHQRSSTITLKSTTFTKFLIA
jgi:hypothetical protein